MRRLPQLIEDRRLDLYEFFRRIYGPTWKKQLVEVHGVKLLRDQSNLAPSLLRYLDIFTKLEAFAMPLGFAAFERNRRADVSDRSDWSKSDSWHGPSGQKATPKNPPIRSSIKSPKRKRRKTLTKPMPIMGQTILDSGKTALQQVPCQGPRGAKTDPPDSLTPSRANLEILRGLEKTRVPADALWET